MTENGFYNLDVVISKAGDQYLAHIVNSPQGRQAQAHFSLPFSPEEAQNWLLTFRNPRHGAEEMAKAKQFGGPLYEAVFGHPEMAHVLRTSIEHADNENKGLRIRLRMNDTPELAELPWEYLYNSARDEFLILSSETPIVRFIELSDATEPLAVSLPLNMLVIIAAPTDQVTLNTDAEVAKINEALGDLIDAGRVTVDVLTDGRIATFADQLTRKDYHIVHFVGHGEFDKATNTGVLLFEDANKKADRVQADMIAGLVSDKDSVRLMVLNACEGAFGDDATIFAGTAQSLVRKGVPGLVAMQFKISDPAAILFSKTFYDLLARGFPLDTALAEARRQIWLMRNNIEWGTPILFVRAKETQLFNNTPQEDNVTEEETQEEEKEGGGTVNQSINIGGSAGKVTVFGRDGVVHNNETVDNSQHTHNDNSRTYNVSDIDAGGGNVVIGEGNTVTSTVTHLGPGQVDPFAEARQALEQAPISEYEKEDVEDDIKKLEKMRDAADVEQDRVDHYLRRLEETAPAVLETLLNVFTNPGAAAGSALKLAIKTYRESRGAK